MPIASGFLRPSRVICLLFAAILVLALGQRATADLCCPADLDGNADVGASDLALLLGAWGTDGSLGGATSADLDASGVVDAPDIGILLGAWGPCRSTCDLTLIAGSVVGTDGAPIAGAMVFTDLGGKGLSGGDGAFEFSLTIPEGATQLTASAIATVNGSTLVGSVGPLAPVAGGVTNVGAITVTPEGAGEPTWLPTVGPSGLLNGPGNALASFDDGTGPAIFVGGEFLFAGAVPASRIARWDGEAWSGLGAGLSGAVRALAVFDDGSGARLIAAGDFTSAGGSPAARIARWDGQAWAPLGAGLNGSVRALAVYDDGSGPTLIAAGAFTASGAAPMARIAAWNGSVWTPLAGGLGGTVESLGIFDAGDGPRLIAGGSFTTAGGAPANRIASWNGRAWQPLGASGSDGANDTVFSLATWDYDHDDVDELYVGGQFETAGGIASPAIARWDGASWSAVGSGATTDAAINAMKVLALGRGGDEVLAITGFVGMIDGTPVHNAAMWNGRNWSAMGTLSGGSGRALSVFDPGGRTGPTVVVAGAFTSLADNVTSIGVAIWEDSAWKPTNAGITNTVRATAIYDDGLGAGPCLYIGGQFTSIGDVPASLIARWDGRSWTSVGAGFTGFAVNTLCVHDDGSGPALYAGGSMQQAGSPTIKGVARWDGRTWSALGAGLTESVMALASYDARDGPKLYAGGEISAGSFEYLAVWNGVTWGPVGGNALLGIVRTLHVFDDGSGPALYVGGDSPVPGAGSALGLARWNGTQWTAVGGSLDGPAWSLTSVPARNGSPGVLYVGGSFAHAGGIAANRIAAWNGQGWLALGTGLGTGAGSTVNALEVGSDGRLYAGGLFATAGARVVNNVAVWDGQVWSSLGAGTSGTVYSILSDDGSFGLPSVFVGGAFKVTPAGDSYLARWGCR